MKTVCRMLLMAGLLAAGAAPVRAVDESVRQAEKDRVEMIRRVAPSVVAIFGNGGQGGGSGVLISPDGYALSNFHVTSGSGNFMKCGLNDGVLYDAVIVGIDPTGDVALIKLLGRDDFPAATLGDSDTVQVGDEAWAMGNPFLLATDFQPTVTYGIVSGVHRYQYPAGTFLEYADCIQVDSSINPGNSGGPLFNAAGQLIGINGRGSFEKRGRVNSGAGYAISINQIGHFIDHLRSGRVVDHATLGAAVTTDAEGRVIVSSILESSDAWRRGLRLDDEIVSFANRPIRSVNQFKNVLGIFPDGWRLPLTWRRDEEKFDALVRLRGVHTKAELMADREKSEEPGPRPKTPMPKKDDAPEKKPDEPAPEPEPKPVPNPHGEGSPPPEKFKHMFIEKAGYANYWFNIQEQNRLKPLVKQWGNYAAQAGAWQATGKTGTGEPFQLTLSTRGIGLQIADDPYVQPLDGTDPVDEPPGSGGLLFAFHQLRQMLTKQEAGFSEFYYLGSEPLDLTGQIVDVLVTTSGQVTTRWYFTRQPASFVGLSSQLTEDAEECELLFTTIEERNGLYFPGGILIRTGGREYLKLTVEKFQTAVSSSPR